MLTQYERSTKSTARREYEARVQEAFAEYDRRVRAARTSGESFEGVLHQERNARTIYTLEIHLLRKEFNARYPEEDFGS